MTMRNVQETYRETVKLYNHLKEIDRELEKDEPNISEEMVNGLLSDAWCYRREMDLLSNELQWYNEARVNLKDMRKLVCSALNKMSIIIRYFNPSNEGYPPELK